MQIRTNIQLMLKFSCQIVQCYLVFLFLFSKKKKLLFINESLPKIKSILGSVNTIESWQKREVNSSKFSIFQRKFI